VNADRIVGCTRCPELRAYCARVAATKKRQYRDRPYWGQPVPAFGDPQARVLIVGLAPGAHGSNRTGRPFTGDGSGVWLYRALHRAGFANQPQAVDRDDGLVLRGAYITSALRCAPPGNKPTPRQLTNCREYLEREIAELREVRVVVGLGRIGSKAAWDVLVDAGYTFDPPRFVFAHGAEAIGERAGAGRRRARLTFITSYHPSRQNTNTGVLTEPMLDAIFIRARALQAGR
jgi:uracil-DNA glycosylase family 4